MHLSLAGWSLNKLFRDPNKPLALIDFPAFTRDTFGIDAVELNNIYFESTDTDYLARLRSAAERASSTLLNIAVDVKGVDLASTDLALRVESAAKYAEWIPIAQLLGCSAIRANSGGRDIVDLEASVASCVDGFRRLCDVGQKHGIVVMVENHWGISADPDVMVRICTDVAKTHGPDAMKTLADFGNWADETDRYDAIRKVMPFAHAVHAKVNDIDEQLNHPRFDHARCIRIAKEAGYDGYLGIEYEGADEPVVGIRRGATLLRQLI